MKKKILAVVLAAATAFSMFGASLSASAASTKAYWPGDAEALVLAELDGDYGYSEVVAGKTVYYADYDEFIDDMEAVEALISDDSESAPKATLIYSYDYTAASWKAFQDALDAALDAAEGETEVYIDLYYDFAEKVADAAADLKFDFDTSYKVSDLREDIIDAFTAAAKEAKDIKKNVTDYDMTDVDVADELAYLAGGEHSTEGTKGGGLNQDPAGLPTSCMLAWTLRYEAFVEDLDLADGYEAMEALEALIEEAEMILDNEEYYKSTTAAQKAFDKLETKLDAAYDVLDDYSVTNSKIKKAGDDLEAAIVAMAKYELGADKAALAELKALIEKAEACIEDPGYATDKYEGDFFDYDEWTFEDVVDFAKDAQADKGALWVDTAIDMLEEAIGDLKVTPAKGSVALKAEEDLAAYFKLVEEDYTEKSWAELEKAMALYDDAVTAKEYEDAVAAVKAVRLDRVSTREAKAEFKKAYKDAWDVAEEAEDNDFEGKSVAAIDAFATALEKADKVYDAIGDKTNSELEAATEALVAATEAFENNVVTDPFNGWNYEKGEGWYYYVNGEKATGWLWDADYNSWFYLNEDGTMKTGWHWDAEYNAWYFLNDNGTMATNRWINDNGTWYYVYESGKMAVNTTINGYTVNASGAWVA